MDTKCQNDGDIFQIFPLIFYQMQSHFIALYFGTKLLDKKLIIIHLGHRFHLEPNMFKEWNEIYV